MPNASDLLHRWSRLKRSGETANEEPGPVESDDPEPAPDELPSIDDLGEDSDYTAFMRRNVPPALRRAALRRAWSAKAAIAGHKPLVDYDWDYHATGFGKLWPGDDPAKLLATLFAAARSSEPAEPPAPDATEEAAAIPAEGSAEARKPGPRKPSNDGSA